MTVQEAPAQKISTFPSEGVFAALWIPTDREGRLLRDALRRHLAWLAKAGVDGVLALGSTGEFPRFSLDERKQLLDEIAAAAGSLKVIANVSDMSASVAAELGRHAARLGLPGISIMPPSFYPVSQDDQLAFFEHVAGAAGLPVMLYNFPELTGNRIGLETIAQFAARAPMAGIKQSGAEFTYHKDLIALGNQLGFSVFSGADTRLAEVFALGAKGCIGGLVNFVPEYMVAIHRAVRKASGEDITVACERMRQVGRCIDRLTFPWNVSTGLVARGFEAGAPKMPVSVRSAELHAGIVAELRGLFAEWNLNQAPAQ